MDTHPGFATDLLFDRYQGDVTQHEQFWAVRTPDAPDYYFGNYLLLTTPPSDHDKGWLEVETPILQPIHGGAAARPFKTHHNTLDMPLFMRIANELYLKRLIVGGFDGVYEFGKMFRNEGMDRTHNPEFTSLEFYIAYKDYNWMMSLTEELLEKVAVAVNEDTKVTFAGNVIDFAGPYPRLSIIEAIEKYTGINVDASSEAELRTKCKEWGMEVEERPITIDELVEDYENGKLEEVFGSGTAAVISPVGVLGYKDKVMTINDGKIGPFAQKMFKILKFFLFELLLNFE